MADTAMTTKQVMERLKLKDPDTVYKLYRAGKIRGGKIGREYRFSSRSIDELLAGAPPPLPSATRRRAVSAATKPGAWRRGVQQILTP